METPPRTSSQIGVRERWLTTALLGLGLITFAIDASKTQLCLPQIMTNMRVDLYQIHWILTAPGIARTVVIASTGWLTGLWGPRTLYLICIGSMTLGSLGTMLAWDWPSLIFFRILAGVGGGMIPQLAQAIFYQIFPPGKRGMALGFALMGWSIGPAFGPLMGGNLLEYASWRAVYTMTLPLSGLGFILAWWWLPYLGRPQRQRLDYYGALTMTVAVSTLLLALSQGNREGWDSQYILTLLVMAGVAAVAFVVLELRHPAPLVDLRLFGSVPFVMAMVVMFLTTLAFRGTGPMFAVLIQRLLGFGPLVAAWSQMPPNLVYGAAVLLVGRLSDRLPTYVLVIFGLLMYAAVFVGYTGINEVTTLGMIMTFLIIRFIAEAFIVSPNNLATLEACPKARSIWPPRSPDYCAALLTPWGPPSLPCCGTGATPTTCSILLRILRWIPWGSRRRSAAGSKRCSGQGRWPRRSPPRPWPCCRSVWSPKPALLPGKIIFCSMPCWPCSAFSPLCPAGGARSIKPRPRPRQRPPQAPMLPSAPVSPHLRRHATTLPPGRPEYGVGLA